MRVLLSLLMLAIVIECQAQIPAVPPAADLAKTGLLSDISSNTWLYFSPAATIDADELPAFPYKKGTIKYTHFIPPVLINRKTVLRFTLVNSGEQAQSVYFCPGFLIDQIRLYRLGRPDIGGAAAMSSAAARVVALPDSLPDDPDSLGYRKITLAAHDTGTFFAVLRFIKASSNALTPTLTADSLIKEGILLQHHSKTSIDIITNIFAGIMLMMIFYAISEYLQSGKIEFLYYIGYSLCISVLLFLKAIL
ncbi:MAG TPA: hypothetical protein VHW43_14075, partial [Puia sp.]|nr:hypothetical protein [Puia sp.]